MSKPQITAKSERKKTVPKSAWKPGQSGNPGGRPKSQHSITYWLNEFGNMTPKSLADEFETYAAELKKGGDKMPFYAFIAVRLLMAQANEPDAHLLALVFDRTEGKLTEKLQLTDWREDARAAGIDPEQLAADLFSKVPQVTSDPGDNPR